MVLLKTEFIDWYAVPADSWMTDEMGATIENRVPEIDREYIAVLAALLTRTRQDALKEVREKLPSKVVLIGPGPVGG